MDHFEGENIDSNSTGYPLP